MPRLFIRMTALICMVSPVALSAQAAAQGLPRLPSIKAPKVPSVPSVPRPTCGARCIPQGNPSGNLLQTFMTEMQKLSNPIDTTTTNEADNTRIDREVADYKALADSLSDGRFDVVPMAQRQPMMQGLKTFYDGAAMATDQEIETANGIMTGVGKADAAYNYLIAHDAYLYAAEKLFPGGRSYSAARGRVASALSKMGGSRARAISTKDEAALAAARNVRMPAAVTSDKGAEAQFRQAWRTSGIPWEIVKINVTSGWRDKVENGRVIGQRRDAAIAARDPNNPDRCNLYDFTMFRDRSGNVRRDSHSTKRIACENIK